MDALENLVAQQEIRDLSAKYAMSLDRHGVIQGSCQA